MTKKDQWEVILEGKKWTDCFPTKAAAEEYKKEEQKKLVGYRLEVRKMKGQS